MIERYVWRDGQFVDPKTGAPMEKKHAGVHAPMVMRVDFEPYKSLVTGKVVDGQRSYKEEVAEARDKGWVPFERIDGHPGGLINKEFARKGGKRVCEATEEWAKKKREAQAVQTDASGAIWSE